MTREVFPTLEQLETQWNKLTNAIDVMQDLLDRMQSAREDINFITQIMKYLTRKVVVTDDGGYGWWPEWRSYFDPKDGVLHFLSPEVEDYEDEVPFLKSDKGEFRSAYVVPQEYFVQVDPRLQRELRVPVVPLTEVKHESCPYCKRAHPVLTWFHEIWDSPEGDVYERRVFMICGVTIVPLLTRQL